MDLNTNNHLEKSDKDFSIHLNMNEIKTHLINNEEKNYSNSLLIARIYAVTGSLFFSISRIFVRTFNNNFPNKYSCYFLTIRLFTVTYFSYFIILVQEKYGKNSKLENKTLLDVLVVNKEGDNWKDKYVNQVVLFRGFLNGIIMFVYFLAFSNLKLGIASTLVSIQPLFLYFLGTIILNEVVSKKYYVALFVSMIGIIILFSNSKGESRGNFIVGITSAIGFAIFGSMINLSSNIIGKRWDNLQVNYVSSFWSFLTFFLVNLLFGNFIDIFVLLDPFFLFISFSDGLIAFCAYFFNFKALSSVEVSKLSYLMYTQILFVTVEGFLIFGEVLSITEILGMIIIVSNILITSYYLK